MHGQPQIPAGGQGLLQVMVVDDEAIVRKDIRDMLDWEACGYQLAAQAENGQDALRQLAQKTIHIIIADIEMPVMDGLELAARVLPGPQAIKFIFLTAYSNFEFARASMRLGIDSYILKHEMDAKTLLNELNRLRGELEKTSQQRQACINEAMHRLLGAPEAESACREVLRANQIPFRGGASFLLSVEAHGKGQPDPLKKHIASAVCHAAQSGDVAGCTTFSMEENSVGALLVMDDAAAGSWRLCVSGCLNNIQEQLQIFLGAPFFLLAGKRLLAAHELHADYQQIKKAREQLYFYRTPCVIFCGQGGCDAPSCQGAVAALCALMENRQLLDAQALLTQLFQEEFPKMKRMEAYKKYLAAITDRFADAWNNEYGKDGAISSTALYQELLGAANVYEACGNLCGRLEQIRGMENARRHERINRIKGYIEAHYADDISLDSLGSLIGVSQAYMSQFFKQQIGVSFKAYLTGIRMQKAADMLLRGEHKVHDIGAKVGYNSTPYFCLVFKQYFGMTPSEYSRRHCGG